jgi:hypothetical protein
VEPLLSHRITGKALFMLKGKTYKRLDSLNLSLD